jgi:sugar phosphate isomerase/epimerase
MGVDARQVIMDHAGHIGSIHLRDGKPPFDANTYVPSVALGDGAAPIRDIMQAALQAGIKDYVLEMVMQPAGGEYAALARSRNYLKSIADTAAVA